jgi:hypothetical protein
MMDSKNESSLRKQLVRTMEGGESHLDFKSVVEDFPADKRGVKPHGAPHSAWQLVEHMRIAQWDILEFSRNPKHKSPKWPEGYWPSAAAPPDDGVWEKSVRGFEADAAAMAELIRDGSVDLFAKIEGGDGQTLLREACVVAAHNSYHLGQLEFLKKMLMAG